MKQLNQNINNEITIQEQIEIKSEATTTSNVSTSDEDNFNKVDCPEHLKLSVINDTLPNSDDSVS